MTKPLYKRDWFQVLLTGVVLTIVGLIFIVDSILSSTYTGMDIWYGIFFGMGQADLLFSAVIWQYEKKLRGKS
jgi:uncharacterized membrane protein YesL